MLSNVWYIGWYWVNLTSHIQVANEQKRINVVSVPRTRNNCFYNSIALLGLWFTLLENWYIFFKLLPVEIWTIFQTSPDNLDSYNQLHFMWKLYTSKICDHVEIAAFHCFDCSETSMRPSMNQSSTTLKIWAKSLTWCWSNGRENTWHGNEKMMGHSFLQVNSKLMWGCKHEGNEKADELAWTDSQWAAKESKT